jgi:hypothetical protein
VLVVVAEEVAHHEGDGAAPGEVAEGVEGAGEVGAVALGLELQGLGDDAHHVAGALAGRHDALDVVGEEQEARRGRCSSWR